MADNIVIIIPARMAATRLPGKPLADIAGRPMIAHVLDRAVAARLGPVFVATDSPDIAAAVERAGGRAVMTRPDHACGTDRIFEALGRITVPADIVINVQGDLPTLDPADIRAALGPLADPAVDIATIAAEIAEAGERENPNVVKVVGTPVAERRLRALYFTRAGAPWGDGPLYHHIGLYAYRRPESMICSLSPRRACPLRRPAAVAAGATREARAIARARGRHAHRRDAGALGAARRRHAGLP
jgi:3-deoxy-manno-octulosonate cytidylyltransferase (CMP-KDO synthetase)